MAERPAGGSHDPAALVGWRGVRAHRPAGVPARPHAAARHVAVAANPGLAGPPGALDRWCDDRLGGAGHPDALLRLAGHRTAAKPRLPGGCAHPGPTGALRPAFAHQPTSPRPERDMTLHRPLLASLTAAALLALSACGTTVVNPVTGEAERTVMDEPTEIAEGAKAHKQVIQDEGIYDNPKLQAYVNGVGQKLAAESHRAHLQWTFTVLDSPEINAFALPGGYVYVTRGIMAYLDSEAELAGVIGHEIGHVTARHGAQRATRQQNAGLGVLAATILGAVLESHGMRGATDIAGQVSQTAAAGYVASYSREQDVVRGREFYHEPLGLALSAPNGWRIANGRDAISVINAAGDAGLVVKLLPEQARGMSHEALIRQLLKADQNRVDGRTEKRQLHGLPATHFAGTLRNAQGQSANVMLTVADGPGGKRYLLRYASQNAQALQRALPGLQEAEASFRELTSAARKAAQPWVIRTVAMPKGGFAELARQSALDGMDPQAEARLKLMNSAYGEKGSGGGSNPPPPRARGQTRRRPPPPRAPH